jgi:chemotaxis protein MotB
VARKKREEEHENHERWLVSYADFITLLFAFFVVMYSISRVDNKRLQQTAASIKWALHMSGTGGSNNMLSVFQGPETGMDLGIQGNGPRGQRRAIELLRQRLERRLKSVLVERHNQVVLEVEGQRLTLRLGASHFFDAGQSALRPEALPVLDAVVGELKPLERSIRVEGHTDSSPVTNSRFKNNWELSSARAATVVAYVEGAHGVHGDLLSAVGHASTHPLSNEDTPEAREANRRIELVVELGPQEEVGVAAR